MSKELSKEEIREKHLYANGLRANKGYVGEMIKKAAYGAMDDWAKQQAIAFLHWKEENNIECYNFERNVWFNQDTNEKYTIDELYNLFLQSTKQ